MLALPNLDRQSFELTHIEMMEKSFCFQQLLVRALLDDLAIVDDDDLVRIADRGQAMGNDETGAAFHQAQQRFLDARFGARVHAGGGFVEDEDARVGQDGAGDGQQLALSLAEVAGALREFGLVALRQLADEVIGVRQFGGFDTLLVGRVEAAVADVLHDGIRKQEGILQDDPQLLAQISFGDLADVASVDRDAAFIDLIEAGQQIDDGGLACTGRTDQGNGLACFRFQRHVLDDGLIRQVAKANVSRSELLL